MSAALVRAHEEHFSEATRALEQREPSDMEISDLQAMLGTSGVAPVSDSEPLRALLLYALVEVAGGAGTVLSMKLVRAVVSAPPARWRWGAPLTDEPEPTEAQPKWKLLKKGSHWRYSSSESDQIWCWSKPFRSTASV